MELVHNKKLSFQAGSTKGQLISEYILAGQNLSNFSLVFWSKRFFEKDILKLTDL